MSVGPQVTIGVRPGYATQTSCKIALASLTNGAMTLTCNGVNYPVTLTAIGTDRGTGPAQAAFTGSVTITGLTKLKRYTYSVTQGANTVSGSFMTAPGETDDFSLFFGGCDNNTWTGGLPAGGWTPIRNYITNGALPTVGIFFVDDHGYVDGMLVNDSAGTGHSTTDLTNGAEATGKVYDYAIGYACNLGMLQNSANQYVAWGREEDRVYCARNINYFPQWGDHEFTNDIGWDVPTQSTTLPSTGPKAQTIYNSGKAAWDAFMKPLQPPSIGSLDTVANHWGMNLGCVKLIAPDGITHGNGTWDRATTAGLPTVVFGNNQIDDCLNYLNSSPQPFNLIGMMHSIRNLSPGTGMGLGAQHPLADSIAAEYQRLFTASGQVVKSVMDNANSNGLAGITVLLHGDYHRGMALKHHAAAYTGNLAENFYSIHLGTLNGSSNFTVPADVVQGLDYASKTLVEFLQTYGANRWQVLRIDVYGSRGPRELHAIIMDENGAEQWHGRWLARSTNGTVPVNWGTPLRNSGNANGLA